MDPQNKRRYLDGFLKSYAISNIKPLRFLKGSNLDFQLNVIVSLAWCMHD